MAQDLTQTIRGKVLDAQSKSPVIGANVVLLGSDPLKGSVTDIDGNFRIEEVKVGRHNLKITFIGYEDLVIPELLVGAGKEVVLDIDLTESLITMEELVIEAEQEKGKPLNEMATVSALSFSVEETSRYAATFDDPARAALSFAGVRGGGDDVLNEIVIRGNSPRGLLWRIEGIEVPNPNHFAEDGASGGGISMLSSSVLSNSDFFTGAFPAEYGNALSGVFDIKLRKGNNEKREYAAQAGLLGVAFAAEGPLGSDSKGSYLANYRYSTLALFDNIGIKILDESEEIVFQDLSFKVHLPTEKMGSFSIWGLGGASEDILKPIIENGEFNNEQFYTRLGVGGISNIFFLNKNTYLESQISYSAHQSEYEYDSLGVKTFETENFINTALRGSVLLNKKFNARHTLRTGVVFSHLGYDLHSEYFSFRQQRLITELDQEGSSQFMRSYAQWNFRPSETVTLNSGLHYTRFFLNGRESLEPRFGAKWAFTPSQSISAGIGVHSRLETLSLYLAQEEVGDGTFVQPNKNLDITKARHYVIGYENQLKSDLRFKAEVYYQDLYDVPIRPASATNPWERTFSSLNEFSGFTTDTLVANGTGTNYGIELTLEKFFTKGYYFMVTGSLFESKYVAADGIERDTRFNGNFVNNIIAGKEFKVGRNGNNLIAINTRMIWAGNNRVVPIDLEMSRQRGGTYYDFDNSFSERLQDYWRLDFGISYRKNKGKHSSIVALNVQNVTGRYNVSEHFYSRRADEIRFEEQLGLFPNLSYRIEF